MNMNGARMCVYDYERPRSVRASRWLLGFRCNEVSRIYGTEHVWSAHTTKNTIVSTIVFIFEWKDVHGGANAYDWVKIKLIE